jgi:hypothetical protein
MTTQWVDVTFVPTRMRALGIACTFGQHFGRDTPARRANNAVSQTQIIACISCNRIAAFWRYAPCL